MNDSPPAQSAREQLSADLREVRSRHPRFFDALRADIRVAAAYRAHGREFESRLEFVRYGLRLMLESDAFLAIVAYRMKARMQALGIPVLPWIAHRLAMMFAQVSIAETVLVHPGVFIPNGQVVIYGEVEISPGVALLPWVTVGPIGNAEAGPRIGPWAHIGTGAKVLGEIELGAQARVGANAVVLDDVPPNTTVVGMPAAAVTE